MRGNLTVYDDECHLLSINIGYNSMLLNVLESKLVISTAIRLQAKKNNWFFAV